MHPRGGGRPTLRQGLDREVFQAVRKILDEQDVSPRSSSAYKLYDSIKRSNSSLGRKPKRQLEDSIDRVLAVMQEDQEDSEEELGSMEGDFPDAESENTSRNAMNQSLRKSLQNNLPRRNLQGPSSGISTPQAMNGTLQKEDAQSAQQDDERPRKRQKRKDGGTSEPKNYDPPKARLEDIGGVEKIQQQLADSLVLPLLRPEVYISRKLPIPRGILLHGPPGCGKTMISRAFAAELGVPFIEILGPSVVSGMSGESEKQSKLPFSISNYWCSWF